MPWVFVCPIPAAGWLENVELSIRIYPSLFPPFLTGIEGTSGSSLVKSYVFCYSGINAHSSVSSRLFSRPRANSKYLFLLVSWNTDHVVFN